MNLDEDAVREALRSLNQKELAGPADNMESRVKKYEHRLQEAFNFTRHEIAILCELLLQSPQTPGELRNRADRMHTFDDLGIRAVHPATPDEARAAPGQGSSPAARHERSSLRTPAMRRCGDLVPVSRKPGPIVISGHPWESRSCAWKGMSQSSRERSRT